MFSHVFREYLLNAPGCDSLRPLSGTCEEIWNGRLLLIESLSTIKTFGFDSLFNETLEFLKKHPPRPTEGKTFEIIIRWLGGLLSAHAVLPQNSTQRDFLLSESIYVGDFVYESLKRRSYSTDFMKQRYSGTHDSFAGIGTNQMEFFYLSRVTNETKYEDLGIELVQSLDSRILREVGGGTDSYVEYLLKTYLLSKKSSKYLSFLKTWLRRVNVAHETMLRVTKDGLLVLLDSHGSMEHLVCFWGGMLVLAYEKLEMSDFKRLNIDLDLTQEKEKWLDIAKNLTRTCYEFYARSPSGLSADSYTLSNDNLLKIKDPKSLLRPETLESLYYLRRLTKDEKYRDWGEKIIRSFENSRTRYGYASVGDVRRVNETLFDLAESFFISETLKYAFLLFSDDTMMENYVLNTEGHPLV